jgi:hypothetical protein
MEAGGRMRGSVCFTAGGGFGQAMRIAGSE